jgi:FkbM family methyltransferase
MSRFGDKSYSQHGEDFMLCNLIELLEIPKAKWLEFGSHHPEIDSNTKLLYERGHRGVNVEANPNLFKAFEDRRPEDINLNFGVGVNSGNLPFYMVDDTSGLNSFKREELERINIPIVKTMELPVVTANYIVSNYCDNVFPELLFTDVEGLDYDIIESCDFTLFGKPRIICTEIRPWEAYRVKKLLEDRGYFVYCRMTANLIFLLNEDRNKVY